MFCATEKPGEAAGDGRAAAARGPRLLARVRERLRRKHYSIRTEQAYVDWIRRFVLFQGKRHPEQLGAAEVEEFLTHLAVAGRVSASTQNQAKSALLFLYEEVLGSELPWLDSVESAKTPQRLPVVLTPEEVSAILGHVEGTVCLILRLLYGTGMRIMECVRLRVKDVDFARREILIRDGKGAKDRVICSLRRFQKPLRQHLHRVKGLMNRTSRRVMARSIFHTRRRRRIRCVTRLPSTCCNRAMTFAPCRNCSDTRM